MSNKQKQEEKQTWAFHHSINNLGIITTIIALVAMFSVPLGIVWYFDIDFNIMDALFASTSLLAIYVPMAVAENISFYSVLGAGGMYLSSITGNILNVKLPVVVSAQKIVGVEPGTDEGDVISIIAVGISSLVTVIILFLGMALIGTWLVPILNHPFVKPGFDNVTPALLGAIAIPQFMSNKKLAITPIVLVLILFFALGASGYADSQSYILLGVMLLSVGTAYIMYKNNLLELED